MAGSCCASQMVNAKASVFLPGFLAVERGSVPESKTGGSGLVGISVRGV